MTGLAEELIDWSLAASFDPGVDHVGDHGAGHSRPASQPATDSGQARIGLFVTAGEIIANITSYAARQPMTKPLAANNAANATSAGIPRNSSQ